MAETRMFETNQTQALVSRLRNLHSIYAHLTMDYLRMPLSCRRYLYGSECMTTQELRGTAQAKFTLVAALQWKPSNHGYDVTRFVSGVGRTERKTGESGGDLDDELCPISINFFDEIVKADRILSAQTGDGPPMVNVEALLDIAEEKYEWLHQCAMVALSRGQYIPGPSNIELTDAMIFSGWNRFCLKVANGVSLADALSAIRSAKRSPVGEPILVHSGQSSQREYFYLNLPMSFQPGTQYQIHDIAGFHPDCRANSPCRRDPGFCPCKARGQERDNSNCDMSGPWKWPCVPNQLPVSHYGIPSYGAGHDTVEDAARASDLFDGGILVKPTFCFDPLPMSATPILETYNAHFEKLSPIAFRIAYPTPSYQLHDLLVRGGLPLSEGAIDSLPIHLLIALKTKSFFLSGFCIAHNIGESPVEGAVVVPKFSPFDTGRMEAVLQQVRVERYRWRPDLLSQRTGTRRYKEPALGNDFVIVAIREAVEELIVHCEEKLEKAKRAVLC